MRRFFKGLARWILRILAVILCFYLVVLLVNIPDEQPSEDVRYFVELYESRPPLDPRRNANFFLRGISAPSFADPHSFGQERVELIRRNLGDPDYDWVALGSLEQDARKILPEEVLAFFSSCSRSFENCPQSFAQQADWSRFLQQSSWLLDRYRRLIEYDAYREELVADPASSIPDFATVLHGQGLLFLEMWEAAGRGDAGAVRDWLGKDCQFWRMMLESSSILIDKMIAAAALRNHFYLANLVSGRLHAEHGSGVVPAIWQVGIKDAERSLRIVFAGEYMFGARLIEQAVQNSNPTELVFPLLEEATFIDKWFSIGLKPLVKLQATNNLIARQWRGLLSWDNRSYHDFYQSRDVPLNLAHMKPGFGLHNPVGKLAFYFSGSTNDYKDYFVRLADLEGMRRANLAVADLRARRLLSGEWPEALKSSEFRNPYMDSGFGVDEEQGAVVFEGLSEGYRRVFYAVY